MKRIALLLTALVLVTGPAHAGTRDAVPTVHIVGIVGTQIDPEDGSTRYVLRIDAHDPDGVISEMVVSFGDGVTVFALMACTPPGSRIVQDFPYPYEPGRYLVRASVFSTSECFAGSFQESAPDTAKVIIPPRR